MPQNKEKQLGLQNDFYLTEMVELVFWDQFSKYSFNQLTDVFLSFFFRKWQKIWVQTNGLKILSLKCRL